MNGGGDGRGGGRHGFGLILVMFNICDYAVLV